MSKKESFVDKTEDQLNSLVLDSKKELMNLRFQQKSGALTNTSRIKLVRKKVAKIKTLLNNRRPLKNAKKVGVTNNA